jgi:hypothetical protein
MANRFEGRMGRGASRKVRQLKREEAEARTTKYRLTKALENSAEGNVESLGDFTQYLESA